MEKEPKYFHINETLINEIWPIDVGYNVIPPNTKVVDIRNKYPYFLMHYVSKGKCFVTMNNETKSFSKGTIFVLFPQTSVEYKNDLKTGWNYYWINFNGTKATTILKNLGITKDNYFTHLSPQKVERIFLKDINSNKKEISTAYKVSSVLFELFGLMSDANTDFSNAKQDDFYVTEYIINYIQENLFSHTLTAKSVSDHFYLNPKYFSTLFKKKFNISFKEYVNYERVKKASELLETTNFSIKYIAETVGFNDSLYFSKVFKKYRLMSPTEYVMKKNN